MILVTFKMQLTTIYTYDYLIAILSKMNKVKFELPAISSALNIAAVTFTTKLE